MIRLDSSTPSVTVRVCLAALLLLGLVGIAASGARAQTYTLQESIVGSPGGVVETASGTLTSAVGQGIAGVSVGGGTDLLSGYPSPFAGVAVLRVVHVLDAPDAPREAGTAVPVTLQVRPAPGVDVTSVRLLYRRGDGAPASVAMTAGADGFEATIPAETVTASGLAYAFAVEDASGRVVRAPSRGVFSFPVQVPAPGIARASTQPSGTTQSAYRLIALPLAASAPDPASVLGDDVPTLASGGAYDRSAARLFVPGTRAEFPNTPPMTVGRAFWLIVADGAQQRPLDTGAGVVKALSAPVALPLANGWNYVGTPFPFSVPVEQVQLESGAPVVLRRYDAGGYNGPDAPVAALEPFEGYAVFADAPTTLTVAPGVAFPADAPTTAASASATQASDWAPNWAPSWALRVRAASAEGDEASALAAVAPGASDARDAFDWPAPPSPGRLAAAFARPAWGRGGRYASDVREGVGDGATWTVDVTAPPGTDVTVSADGVEEVPAAFDVWLLDPETKQSRDLRRSGGHTGGGHSGGMRVTTPETGTARVELLVGPDAFVRKTLRDAGALPTETTVGAPFPNPMTRGTTIHLGLPTATAVTMTVYNVLGQRVATVHRGTPLPAGVHRLHWSAHAGSRPVASGLYVVRIHAGDVTATRKVVVVR